MFNASRVDVRAATAAAFTKVADPALRRAFARAVKGLLADRSIDVNEISGVAPV